MNLPLTAKEKNLLKQLGFTSAEIKEVDGKDNQILGFYAAAAARILSGAVYGGLVVHTLKACLRHSAKLGASGTYWKYLTRGTPEWDTLIQLDNEFMVREGDELKKLRRLHQDIGKIVAGIPDSVDSRSRARICEDFVRLQELAEVGIMRAAKPRYCEPPEWTLFSSPPDDESPTIYDTSDSEWYTNFERDADSLMTLDEFYRLSNSVEYGPDNEDGTAYLATANGWCTWTISPQLLRDFALPDVREGLPPEITHVFWTAE